MLQLCFLRFLQVFCRIENFKQYFCLQSFFSSKIELFPVSTDKNNLDFDCIF